MSSNRVRSFVPRIVPDGTIPAQGLVSLAGGEDLERQRVIALHEERLNWRLQRAFEDYFPGRAFQQPRPRRPRSVTAKPAGFA